MITASKLAGFFAAHAIWCVSGFDEPAPFIPIYAYTTNDGGRQMQRLAMDDLAAAVAMGKERLESNEADADDAVFLFDGRISVGNTKLDAVIVEMRAYFSLGSEAVIAIPYMPRASGKFAVHKPKLLQWKNCDDFDMDAVLQSFFAGVAEHEKGAKVWNDALDESR